MAGTTPVASGSFLVSLAALFRPCGQVGKWVDFGGTKYKIRISKSKGGQNMRSLFFFFGSNSLKIGSFLDSHRLIDVRFMGVFVDIIRQFSMYKKRCFPTFLHKQYVHMSDRIG